MSEKNSSVWAKSIPIKEQIRVIVTLVRMAKPFRKMFFGALAIGAAFALLQAAAPRIIAYYMTTYLQQRDSVTLQVMISFAVLVAVIRVSQAVADALNAYYFTVAAEYALEDIRVQVFRKLHTLGMRFFDQVPAGSLVTRVNNDTASLADFWRFFMQLTFVVMSMIGAYIGMLTVSVKATLLMLIVVPFIVGSVILYQRFSSSLFRHMRERLSHLNAKIAESITGIDVIQEFYQEDRFKKSFAKVNGEYFNARFRMVKADALLLEPMVDMLLGAAMVLVFWYFGVMSMSTVVSAGVIYAFTTYLNNIFSPLESVMNLFSPFQEGLVSGYRILGILADDTYAPAQNVDAKQDITAGKIAFQHVDFSYDGQHQILKDLNFTANPGDTVALVGHTGSGKSSTINALMRFYEFQSGNILIDDHDIRDIALKNIRQKMGLVLQDPFMFFGDISSNIRMYDDTITDEQVKAAAEFVGADKFISALPGNYHAKVQEGGSGFSAGEKQLISFARAIVRDPKILILDEATANVDTETEALIQKSLLKMRQNRTTIAIAHRLSTIKDADLILVLDKGEVVEHGTHEELLQLQGQYYDLYRLQGITNDSN
ncbi:MAG: ABC transporter ATP-binding protein [Leuconostoc gelidum]|jgi:ATP-binding cassette subfamily B multidrug efflux pump|uniref:ABC transporter ATP-binding protein n=1 Tax=Leuconostoc gelidum subsp. gelidum TaxID=1607839 RepID=A0ABS7V247_LEUGE|nr:ABC transporter ATP-binding protein [Leuconostoc gelidum]MBZ5964887.1 ABC transporter ATP-binding protein [Leuconostoc gelidum subsp. gelidum]MBZ5979312.1 ABC transporter ATP-binding protein [Leuconostoc gelidum subsp. gelidum]MBZ5999059.1 ABC transporter ATP-binding protein [Leuconostoc gelidum subsp. gelidum]MBZ6002197.1 ABC transporter ATP-binding protein [Leuconostoc gelidum subsp. gelidum]QDJ30534.1 multidrug ABC transporter ATP-binding protein [Leuconostoc gelidum subsp. gelidum]